MRINFVLFLSIIIILSVWATISSYSYLQEIYSDFTGGKITYIVKQLDRDLLYPDEGYVRFYGYVAYLDDHGLLKPICNIRVEIRGVRTFFDQLIEYRYTNKYGFFIIDVNKKALEEYKGVFLKFAFDSDAVHIVAEFDKVVSARMSLFVSEFNASAMSLYVPNNLSSSLTISRGAKFVELKSGLVVYYVLGGICKRAAPVYNYIMMAYDYIRDIMDVPPPKVKVSIDRNNLATYYDIFERVIYICGDPEHADWLDFSVIVHEYAHFLHSSFSELPPYARENHRWNEHTDPITAWVEGFADFFPSVIKDYYGMKKADRYIDAYGTFWLINESLEEFYVPIKDEDYSDVECAVAAFMWDLYDSHSDDMNSDGLVDNISMGFRLIWNVIISYDPDPSDPEHNRPWTIHEFIEGLRILYPWVDNVSLEALLREHGIRYGGFIDINEIVRMKKAELTKVKILHYLYNYLPRFFIIILTVMLAIKLYRKIRKRKRTYWIQDI